MKKIVLFGGSFNPPGEHHRSIATRLSHDFDEVVIIPCGPRPDKAPTIDADPIYRAAMIDMAFRDIPKTRVELFDMESTTFMRTIDLDKKFKSEGEVWHLVGGDLIKGGTTGQSEIQQQWKEGAKLWKEARFVVVTRAGIELDKKDLPPHHRLLELEKDASSSEIRSLIFQGKPFSNLVNKDVFNYITRHGLYRGRFSRRSTLFRLDEIRPLIVVDTNNLEAQKIAEHFPYTDQPNPNVIIVIGGDGAMLRTIRKHWRRRLPFFGVNAGHLGFLLNDRNATLGPNREYTLHQLPLLWVESESVNGEKSNDVAFNDAWVERSTGQTGLISVSVNGQERIPKLMADAALVATAAGSGSYARAMGAAPLPFNTPTLLLVGSNVLQPTAWKSAVLTLDSEIEFRALDSIRRPLHGFIDGVDKGPLKKMKIRLSFTASVELLFDHAHDPAEKIAKIQFPSIDA